MSDKYKIRKVSKFELCVVWNVRLQPSCWCEFSSEKFSFKQPRKNEQ